MRLLFSLLVLFMLGSCGQKGSLIDDKVGDEIKSFKEINDHIESGNDKVNKNNQNQFDEIMSIKTPKIKTKNDSLYQEIMSAKPKP